MREKGDLAAQKNSPQNNNVNYLFKGLLAGRCCQNFIESQQIITAQIDKIQYNYSLVYGS